jgi:hypothetical protein
MSLRKDLTGSYTNNETVEFPDKVTIPLNIQRSKSRATIPSGAGKKGGVKASIANFSINLLEWIQNKLDNSKITVNSVDGAAVSVPGPYADDTAAGVAGVEIGGLYYETTTGIVNVRLA